MNKIQFADQEKIIYSIRRHWLAFLVEILFILLGGTLPYFLYAFRKYFTGYHFLAIFFQHSIFIISSLFWLQFLLIMLFVAFSDHYLDAWLITDSRIIDIEQKGTFRREVSSLRYDSFADVVFEKAGILEGLFGFGTLRIQKTEDKGDFVMADIYNPKKVHEIILEEQKKNLERLATAVKITEQPSL